MLRGFGVQLQGPRERIDNLSRWIRVATHFQSQVVLGTDAGQHCQLLAAQTRDASARAGNQPDILGPHLLAPRTQVVTQRVGLDRHHWSLSLSLPVPGIKAASPTDPRGADRLRKARWGGG